MGREEVEAKTEEGEKEASEEVRGGWIDGEVECFVGYYYSHSSLMILFLAYRPWL